MSESKLFTRNIRNKNKNIKLSDLGVNYLLPNVPIKHTASNSKILDIDQITTERSLEQSATPILSTRKQDE